MIPLYDKCPEFGKQMIAFALKDEEGLPDGDYVLFEAYCDNPDCDCRNVTIQIMAAPPKVKNMATISYGWESRKYYESVADDEETVNRLYGFHLLRSRKSKRAAAFMNIFEKMIRDTNVRQRIKNHYKHFRAAVQKEALKEDRPSASEKIGRNDPCLCGSGKKYKMCCGR